MKTTEVSDPDLFARLLEDLEERSAPTRITPEARDAYAKLTAAMEHHRPPCADDDRFTAGQVLQIEYLARACAECPIRTECGTYAQLAQPTAGFWAGVDYTEGTS
ncbi:WhiB family transcriptional regulator [Microbacterium sp. ISL-59]|uniref:WhiB family transcriptional regulator n=1 Tax=Microbacterium sp. ISL-59 TaxID=2819159 RepID=UPI001BE60377|nr:WhiB family transcriptional regulator [Microbacterium sp. ISL-59]MBT2497133.1 WhiB family transcriptional regulator [Microbacterium sp. ISL-59]